MCAGLADAQQTNSFVTLPSAQDLTILFRKEYTGDPGCEETCSPTDAPVQRIKIDLITLTLSDDIPCIQNSAETVLKKALQRGHARGLGAQNHLNLKLPRSPKLQSRKPR